MKHFAVEIKDLHTNEVYNIVVFSKNRKLAKEVTFVMTKLYQSEMRNKLFQIN